MKVPEPVQFDSNSSIFQVHSFICESIPKFELLIGGGVSFKVIQYVLLSQ
ncbi:MAG: hypothetical protein Q8S84_07810 [bacterium]|nr:hypothetical protein [bacterium]MDP3381344.1 hypothetical protein [bacterium]